MGIVGDFFKKKRKWSFIKDSILEWYLTPYIAKILATRKPLMLVDCFAGKGKFDDGKNGSPLILAKKIEDVLSEGKYNQVEGVFIEKKYTADLRKNLQAFFNCWVIDGSFEDNFENILARGRNKNIFVYIDPYGIKSLSFSRFEKLKQSGLNTYEMLMNLNTFGFLREGCRLLKCGLDDNINLNSNDDDDLVYETDELNNSNGVTLLNEIADGDYWQSILRDYHQKKYDMFMAEELFISEYMKRLKDKNIFKYAVNIPIKIKINNIPKYRLIFGSNYIDGLLLMCDNMNKQWDQMFVEPGQGKLSLKIDDSKQRLPEIIRQILGNNEIDLKNLYCALIEKNGIFFSIKDYKKALKDMEKREELLIIRKPSTTPTGKPATSLDYTKYKIGVKLTP